MTTAHFDKIRQKLRLGGKDIGLVAIFTALVLTAGVGGWTVLTTSHVKAAAKVTNSDAFRGSTTIGGALFFVPAAVY